MKIKEIRADLLSCPFPERMVLPYWGGVRIITKRDALLVRVYTEGGMVGYGAGSASLESVKCIEGEIAPALVGKDFATVEDIERLWDGVVKADRRRERPRIRAIGGVDIALYDILGKAEGKRICELLGGQVRQEVRVYASGGMYQPPEGYAEEALELKENGFTAYKFRPALGPQEDIRLVEVLREAVGEDFELMADVAAWWSSMGALNYTFAIIRHIARQYELLNVYLMEQPFPPPDTHLYRALRWCVDLRISGGESQVTLGDYLRLLRAEALDIVQVDTCNQGGFTGCQRILEAAKAAGLPYVPHNWGTSLNALANAQLLAAYSEEVAPWMEYPAFRTSKWRGMYPFPAAEEILVEPLDVRNSYLVLPKGPGLGMEVNEEVVDRYPYIQGPWSRTAATYPHV